MPEPIPPECTVDQPSDPQPTTAPSDQARQALDAGPTTRRVERPAPSVQLRDLDADAEPPLVQQPSPETPRDGASRYQIFGEIARGGMGAVLKARDTELGREIAIKVMLEVHRERGQVAERFLEEAQIAGQLQHPGIVPVYELGQFADRRPYFTMKLIRGQTLATLLARRGGPGDDRPRFLKIFEQVCQTVAYAHARGVIHRDLKPANVMVGSFGEVQVMDWGLAKVLRGGAAAAETRPGAPPETDGPAAVRTLRDSSGSETQAGSVLGTPAYMPPEQARGDVDHLDERADVFGLGAILCEILTGRPAYWGGDFNEIRRKAFRADLTDAAERLARCGADAELVALCRRCLAAEPAQRPRDAQAVAAELTAYLGSVEERLRRAEVERAAAQVKATEERKRRRVQLALAASVFLMTVLGGGGWFWVSRQEAERQRQELAARGEKQRQVEVAIAEAHRLRAAANWVDAQAEAKRAETLLEGLPPDAALSARIRELRAELAAEQADRKLLADLNGASLAATEGGGLHFKEGHGAIFNMDRSAAAYRRAFADYGLVAGETDPTAAAARLGKRPRAVQEEALSALVDWSTHARHKLVQDPTGGWAGKVVAALGADPWTARVAEIKREPDAARRRGLSQQLAGSVDVAATPPRILAQLAGDLLRLDGQAATTLLLRAQLQYPGDFWINTALSLWVPEHLTGEQVIRFSAAALACRPQSGMARHNLMVAFASQNHWDEALAMNQWILDQHPDDRAALNHKAEFLAFAGRLKEAEAICRHLLSLSAEDPTTLATLGDVLRRQGRQPEAEKLLRRAVQLDASTAVAHANLGLIQFEQRRWGEAIESVTRAADLDARYHRALSELGLRLWQAKQLSEALTAFRRAEARGRPSAAHYGNLAATLAEMRKLDEAEAAARKAIALDPNMANARGNLAVILSNQQKWAEAVEAYRRASELSPREPAFPLGRARALRKLGRFGEAAAAYREALQLNPNWQPAKVGLAQVERCAALLPKVAAVVAGTYRPGDMAERFLLIELCMLKEHRRAAVRLWAEAFAANPGLANDLRNAQRYNAACAAALAGCGKDAELLDDRERAALRQQALDWLRADLDLRRKQAAGDRPEERKAAEVSLRHWLRDRDFAGVRDEAALRQLPAADREMWSRLWAEVQAVLAKLAGQAGGSGQEQGGRNRLRRVGIRNRSLAPLSGRHVVRAAEQGGSPV